MISFHVSKSQFKILTEWMEEQDRIALSIQKETMHPAEWEELTCNGEYPYYGTSSGEVHYKFIPTSIGTMLKVYHSFTKQEIDLTEYDNW